MKVWVEDTSVEDIKSETFLRTGGGSTSDGQPEDGQKHLNKRSVIARLST